MQPGVYDQDIRKEVVATLKANPGASLDTVLTNWRYHRHGTVEEKETALVGNILEDERALMVKRELTGENRPWWHLW